MNENNWFSKWSTEQVKTIVQEQNRAFWEMDLGIQREQLASVQQAASVPHTVVISGLRRVGKSTLLGQLAHQFGKDQFYYLNFEDERFVGFEAGDMNSLYQILVEIYGEREIFILDEIQNIPEWERFVRRFMDMGFKFFITGSNASLIRGELGSRLTGRYVPVELFPFSFREFLQFRNYPVPEIEGVTTTDRGRTQKFMDEYLQMGGIPETLKYPDLEIEKILYDDVLYRDIATRHNIQEVAALRELAHFLMSNPANLVSYNKLKERLKLGSVNTVKNYIHYLESGWLIFTVNVYAYSVKRQQVAPKKVYVIDTGLARSIGFSFSSNRGRLLENLVFLALRRKYREIYYYTTPSGFEVDFYIPESGQLIQVVQEMNDPDTRKRELRALFQAMEALDIQDGMILSEMGSDNEVHGEHTVKIRSMAEWLVATT